MLGGSRLKRIFQQHFPPSLQGKLKGLYNAFGRYRVYFIRQKKKSLSHPKIILTAGFLKSNSNDLIKLPDLSKELDADGIEVGPFYGVDADTPDLAEIKTALADIEKRAIEKKVSLHINRNDFKKNYRAQKCLWPWQGIYITVKGDIKPCCSRAYYTESSFGNIYEHNFDSIWHGAEYIDFRKGLTGEGPLPVICRGCPCD